MLGPGLEPCLLAWVPPRESPASSGPARAWEFINRLFDAGFAEFWD